jgi:hypothetical protein
VPLAPRDAALTLRLSDEDAAARLAALMLGRNVTLHPRAASLAALLRKTEAGAAAVARALEGDAAPMQALLFPASYKGTAPALLHATAIWFAEMARALPVEHESAVVESWVRALAAWLALREERAYLESFATGVLGGNASAEEKRVAVDRAYAVIREHAEAAHAGATTLSRKGRLHVLALRAVDRAARLAGLDSAGERAALSRAEAALADVAEEALRPIGDALDAAAVGNETTTTRGNILRRSVAAWFFSGFDVLCEHFAVDRATPIAWENYRVPGSKENRVLLEPLMPLFESLARRAESDPMHLPYAARCAEIMLFYFELEPSLEQQIRGCERVLKVCPTHHNGRMVLAQYLCTKATRLLIGPIVTSAQIKEATAVVDRAEGLYPDTTQIAKARGRIEEAKKSVVVRWP